MSFQTRGAEKVGIVGRTGSGKSSIFQALYRLAELDRKGNESPFPSVVLRRSWIRIVSDRLDPDPMVNTRESQRDVVFLHRVLDPHFIGSPGFGSIRGSQRDVVDLG